MDQAKNKNTKTASQSWRKRPRKFAPKSRLGCKTCKIRRIKCDLARPSCLKCQSTGRTCDGYDDTPPASKSPSEKANEAESPGLQLACTTTTSACEPNQWHAQYDDLFFLQNPGPLMILPVTQPAETEAMCFFEHISTKHLSEYSPCASWQKTVMFFSHTVPAVRHAAIALALVHRNYLDRNSGGHTYQPPSSKDSLADNAPLLHYNRAIRLLLDQETGSNSTELTAITLLACFLFTCFDQLEGNYVQAMKHLSGGVELSRNMDKAVIRRSPNSSTSADAHLSSGIHTLIDQTTRQIRRLDMQAATFLVDWTPVDTQEATFAPQLPPSSDAAFHSLDDAADHLYVLVARAMRLCNAQQQQTSLVCEVPPSPSLPLPQKDVVLGQLETWLGLFEGMLLRRGRSQATSPETCRLISLLRMQQMIAWTYLSSYGPGREMDYDHYLPQFQQCVVLAGDVAAAHERYSGSLKATFTPETGIVSTLYIIGVKCRHPVVRREALRILQRRPIREAVWDSTCVARVVERVIEIEEGQAQEGGAIPGMEQIPVWQRIEDLSWVHATASGQSAAGVDIRYSFCGRNGVHTESLRV